MKIESLHDWEVSTAEARLLQIELAARVDTTTPLGPWRYVAAADASYTRGDTRMYAAVVVVDLLSDMAEVERVGVESPISFPYVPGLLTFREAPPVLEAFRRLQTVPDVVLFDGQGIAHPRRIGLASHVGLWLGLPTIGCAKSRLCGTHIEPGPRRGSLEPLEDQGEQIGVALRTRDRIKPLYVSVGHRITLDDAVAVVLATAPRVRLPEPARLAHGAVNDLRRVAQSADPPRSS
jgi:deoxyribonuclease V